MRSDQLLIDEQIRDAVNAVLNKIRAEIYQLHGHPKLDFIKNDEVVDMALVVIDRQIGDKE